MNAVETAAYITVAKACGLAWLGIFCVVFGWMYEPAAAAMIGAVLSLSLALILIVCSWHSLRKPYHRTEMWIYIKKEDRPPKEIAQQIVGRTLHDTYQRFARQVAWMGAGMLAAGLTLRLLGIETLPSLMPAPGIAGTEPVLVIIEDPMARGFLHNP